MKIIKLGITPIKALGIKPIKALGITPIKGIKALGIPSIYESGRQAQKDMDFRLQKKKAVNKIIADVDKKYIPTKTVEKPKPSEVNVTIGLFFDGTGNNRYASELVYYNEKFWDSKIMSMKEKEVKDAFEKFNKDQKLSPISFKNIKEYKREKHMFDDESAPSYLNPYSNIVLLHDIYPEQKYDPTKKEIILKQYVQGIGTWVDLEEDGITPKKYYEDDVMGSSSGRGARGAIARAEQGLYAIAEKLKKEVEENNLKINLLTVDIFGFSRGATAARHCANEFVKEKTSLFPNNYGVFGTFLDSFAVTFPKQLDIRFLGLFDTVVADTSYDENSVLSIPKKIMVELPELIQDPRNVLYEEMKGYQEIKTSLKQITAKVIHIMAIDEFRENFPLTVSDAPNNYQVYLYGSHSDIGGGYAESNYRTLLEYAMIGNDKEKFVNFEKVAKSYENKFAWEFINGKWTLNEHQIEIIQGEKRFSNPRPTSNQPPVFIGYDYEMYDSRFITNKIYLVSLNVMKQYAMQCGVPFPTTISKILIPVYSDLRFYELPSDKPFLQRYNDMAQKMVKDPARNALSLSSEDYFNLYHHCVHISGNYNRSILGRGSAKNLPVLFINRPTENKKRKFLKPK